MPRIEFGWTAPVIGVPESGGQPIVIQELDQVLPVVAQHFDSVWAADHFYGFDRIDDPYLEFGGGGEKLMLRLVARLADWWDTGGTPETYARKLDVLRQHCEEVGRDINTIVRSVGLELPPPADTSAARQMAQRIQQYVDLGVTQFNFDCRVVTNADLVRRIGEDVLSRFR